MGAACERDRVHRNMNGLITLQRTRGVIVKTRVSHPDQSGLVVCAAVVTMDAGVEPAYILSLLRKLLPSSGEQKEAAGKSDDEFEDAGCTVWDLSADADACLLYTSPSPRDS